MRKAVFLDKDGTLVKNIPFNVDLSKIEILSKVIESLKALKEMGYLLIIVSNQSGIGRGYFTLSDFQESENYLIKLLNYEGVNIDGFYFCPHHPNEACDCRKPKAGMLRRASMEMDIDLKKSWMIGDILDDVEAGKKASCKTILLNSSETEWEINEKRTPDFICETLEDAAQIITIYDLYQKIAYD